MTAMLTGRKSKLDHLLDLVIESASDCLRERTILRGIDWQSVPPSDVRRLVENIENEGLKLPPWLAVALISAGHVLTAQDSFGPALNALNALNRLRSAETDAPAGGSAADIARAFTVCETIEPEIAAVAIKQILALNQADLATRVALAQWRFSPQLLRSVRTRAAELREALPAVALRVTGVSNPSGIAADLGAAFAASGYNASVSESDYGQAFSELLQPGDAPRDALVVLLDLDGLHPRDWRQEPASAYDALMQKTDLLCAAIEAYAAAGRGPVVLNTLSVPAAPTAGLIDSHHFSGAARAVQHLNRRLYEIAEGNGHVVLVETQVALADIAPRKWIDPKIQFYGRMPFSAEATRHLAAAFAQAYRCLKRGPAKVLALDLDNTMWGGIFGEDGVGGLLCDDEFPGNAFKAFQNECLRLKSQGMLLAVLSKNNPDAIGVFADHPGMMLREDDFVATRIDWEPKAHNIRSLAEELNLGLDSFVFLDDSPHERDAMRRVCPEVTVPELPDDPASRPMWLRSLAVTWPVRLTEEDSRRSEMYQSERKRSALRQTAAGLEDYLAGLEQQLVVETVSLDTLARTAQLHLRTNQFNLTTQRFDEAAISNMLDDDSRYVALIGRAIDKFGDHGLSICATVEIDADRAIIRSLLMSCRIIGRGIEKAFLAEMLRVLADRGVTMVEGIYIPTEKNAIVRGFYADAGFAPAGARGEATCWSLELSANMPIARVEYIAVRQQ